MLSTQTQNNNPVLAQFQDLYSKTRQNQEKLKSHQDFLSRYTQNNSIKLDDSRPQSDIYYNNNNNAPNTAIKSPKSKTSSSLLPSTIKSKASAAQELSPRERFNIIKQDFLSGFPSLSKSSEKLQRDSTNSEPNLQPQENPSLSSLSVFNNVDKMIEKIKKKHESWNLVEEKVAANFAMTQASMKGGNISGSNKAIGNPLAADDVDFLIERIKKDVNREPSNRQTSKTEPSKLSPIGKSETTPIKTQASPQNVNNNPKSYSPPIRQSPEKLEKAQAPQDHSPIKRGGSPVALAEDDKDDLHLLLQETKPNKESGHIHNKRYENTFEEEAPLPKSLAGAEFTESRRNSSASQALSSGNVSFNISQSAINSPNITRNEAYQAYQNQENPSVEEFGGQSRRSAQEKGKAAAPLGSISKQIEQQQSEETMGSNKGSVNKGPIKPQNNQKEPSVSSALPRVVSQIPPKSQKITVAPKEETKPKFAKSFKEKMAQLKNSYANNKPSDEEIPALKKEATKETKSVIAANLKENINENLRESNPFLINLERDETAVKSRKNEDETLDDLMSYSKATEEKQRGFEDTEIKINVGGDDEERINTKPETLPSFNKDISPLPRRQLDFENASEISFSYSPENSVMIGDFLRGKESGVYKKDTRQNQQQHQHDESPIKIEPVWNEPVWNEQLQKEFDAYCEKDLEIIKLRNKIKYLDGEIALLKMQEQH